MPTPRVHIATLAVFGLAFASAQATATPNVQFHKLATGQDGKVVSKKPTKPSADTTQTALDPVVFEMKAHYHADGSVSHRCEQVHDAATIERFRAGGPQR